MDSVGTLLSVGQSFAPVTRFAAAICNGNNENEIALDRINHAVRKCVREASPDILFDNTVTIRSFNYLVDESFDLKCKRCAKALSASLVKRRRFAIFETVR